MAVALTSLSHGAGCGCKLPPSAVHPLVADLPRPDRPDVLVGFSTADDAGVVKLRDDLAIVQTVDFFTPIVDDPYDFGRIAATNALSDVYAMGGEPVSALNLVAFPLEQLGPDVLKAILRGGNDVCTEAGCAIVGGHSIDDAEPKYGLAVTGTVHPDEILTNAGARAGDVLVLTKPLGAGAISTATKRGLGKPDLTARAVEVMTTLNRDGAAAARKAGAHALTDVTGFGLLGHAIEMARGAGVTLTASLQAVPLLAHAAALAQAGCVTGASHRNWTSYGAAVSLPDDLPDWRRHLLTDPQTSGGLLVACAPQRTDALLRTIVEAGYPAASRIGHVEEGPAAIRVVG